MIFSRSTSNKSLSGIPPTPKHPTKAIQPNVSTYTGQLLQPQQVNSKHLFYPPFKFSPIEQALYRGAEPTSLNASFLKLLGLKTIISCVPGPVSPYLKSFCTENNISLIFIPIEPFDGSSDPVSIPPTQMSDILTQLISVQRHPIYLHCISGHTVTGTIIMCLRRLQNWAFSSILQEFQRFASSPIFPPQVSSYVEHFSVSVNIPHIIPKWLWPTLVGVKDSKTWIVLKPEQQSIIKHPLLDLEFSHALQSMDIQPLNTGTPLKQSFRGSPFDVDLESLPEFPLMGAQVLVKRSSASGVGVQTIKNRQNVSDFTNKPLDSSSSVESLKNSGISLLSKSTSMSLGSIGSVSGPGTVSDSDSLVTTFSLVEENKKLSDTEFPKTTSKSAYETTSSSSAVLDYSSTASDEDIALHHINQDLKGYDWTLLDSIDSLLDTSKLEWYIKHVHTIPFLEYISSSYNLGILDPSSMVTDTYSIENPLFSTLDILVNEFDILRNEAENTNNNYSSHLLVALDLAGISVPHNIENTKKFISIFPHSLEDGSSSSSESDW